MSENASEIESLSAWNDGPIHISTQRMRLPIEVLQELFQLYILPEIRSLVKFIFHLASIDSSFSIEKTTLLQKQSIILIEAVWLLNTNAIKTKSDRIQTIVYVYFNANKSKNEYLCVVIHLMFKLLLHKQLFK
jgi:hypothetical protein